MPHETRIRKTILEASIYRGINIVKFSDSNYLVVDTEVGDPAVQGHVLGFTRTLGEAQNLINHYL